MLEVCESDFTSGLAEMIATEESAAKAYDKETKENEIEKATKTQDVKYNLPHGLFIAEAGGTL